MTLSSNASRIRYEGDGATSSFPVPFKFFDTAHVRVTLRDAADREILWSEGTEYSLTGAGNDSGGTLTAATAPQDFRPKAGESLVIALVVPFTQEKSFPLGGAFPSTQVEEGFDLAVQRDAQLAEFDRRVMSVPASDTQVGQLELAIDSLRAGKYLGFDATGKPTVLAGTAEAADLSDKTVLPTGASQARTIADLFGQGALTAENVRLHGAKGDTRELSDGTVTDGTAVLSSASVSFTEADLGKVVWVEAANSTGAAISNAVNGPIDAVWQFDASAGTFEDLTEELNDAVAGDVEPFPAAEEVGDLFYLGHVQTFDKVTIDIGTPGVGGTLAWEYWDGVAWQALSMTDGTSGLTAAAGSHDITFTPPVDWAATQINRPINGRKLFYIRARLTALYTTNPILDQATLSGGRIRLTATGHGLWPSLLSIKGVVGTTEANNAWQVERIDANTLDLIGPSFQNAYVSGGTIHGRLVTTIAGVAGGDAMLAANAGASINGTAILGYGSDDTAAIQAAIDTGKTVVVPDGGYISSMLTLNNEAQKVVGMGGKLYRRPNAIDGPLLRLTANRVEICGLYMDSPGENRIDDVPGFERATAIFVQANQVRVQGNYIRRFHHGVSMQFFAGDTHTVETEPEFRENRITDNILWDMLGAAREDSGDAIVSWGAATVIANNIVRPRDLEDPRIGIHVEALPSSHVTDAYAYEDRLAVISGNIVLSNGIDCPYGRYRRGIVSEGVGHTSIVGNALTGCGWASILVSAGGSSPSRGDISIVGNSILFDRPENTISTNFPITGAISATTNGSNVVSGIVIANNNIRITGSGSGIRARTGQNSQTVRNVTIADNAVTIDSTNVAEGIVAIDVEHLTIKGNLVDGPVRGTAAIFALSPQENTTVIGNTVRNVETNGIRIQHTSGSNDNDHMIVSGNHVHQTSGTSLALFNAQGVVVTGNVLIGSTGNAIDMFGSDEGVVAHNVTRRQGGGTITNWTASGTKLLDNNLHL